MAFATDDIYRLGGSQRAKLQYHILAQRFPLVYVAAEDKKDLERFAAQSETEAAKNRERPEPPPRWKSFKWSCACSTIRTAFI